MTETLRAELQQLAHQAPARRMPDGVAAQLAWRSRRRRWRPAVVLAAAVAFSVVVLAALSGVLALRGPTPALPARGSGALPARIVVPPLGTPLVTEQPIERASYVIATDGLRRRAFSRGIAPVVVSADGGAYRIVPWHDGDHGLSLSPDGRRLAWVQGDVPLVVTRTVVLTLATGEVRQVPGAPTAADGTAWSDDGTRLLVWGARRVSENTTQDAVVQVHDPTTLGLVRGQAGSGPAAMVGGSLLVPSQEPTASLWTVETPRAIVSPDGSRTAQVVMDDIAGETDKAPRLFVHETATPPDDFTVPVWLSGLTYAEVLAWTEEGILVAEYAGSQHRGPAQVVLLDPATGALLRTLTALPPDAEPDRLVDVSPQVVAVATQVLQGGQVVDTSPRTWPWHSVERLRWWVSDPLRAGLQVGLGIVTLAVVVLLTRTARRP